MEEILAEFATRCSFCVTPLHDIFIVCTQCKEVTVRLCLYCFSCGVEAGSHRKAHSYTVHAKEGASVFQPTDSAKWSLAEEKALIEAVDRFNLGNWTDVASVVDRRRSVHEMKTHYDSYYIRGKIGNVTMTPSQVAFLPAPQIVDHCGPNCDAAVPSTSVSISAVLQSPLSPPVRDRTMRQNVDDLKLMAYMPKRDDFEKELHNEADEELVGLTVHDSSDEVETGLKLAVVRRYSAQVKERRRWKAVVRDYDLVPLFLREQKPVKIQLTSQQMSTKGGVWYSKEEKEARENLNSLRQYIPLATYNNMMKDLMRENALKRRVQLLQNLRRDGQKNIPAQYKKFDIERLATPKTKKRRNRCIATGYKSKSASRYVRWRTYMTKQVEAAWA